MIESGKSFLVPKGEIAGNDHDSSFNKYSATEHERIEYPPTEEILADLADLADLNARTQAGLAEFQTMLAEDAAR